MRKLETDLQNLMSDVMALLLLEYEIVVIRKSDVTDNIPNEQKCVQNIRLRSKPFNVKKLKNAIEIAIRLKESNSF